MNQHDIICCPRCGSDNVRVVIERKEKNFDVCGGVLGGLCLGPIGILCGLCTADEASESYTGICNDCGAHFHR